MLMITVRVYKVEYPNGKVRIRTETASVHFHAFGEYREMEVATKILRINADIDRKVYLPDIPQITYDFKLLHDIEWKISDPDPVRCFPFTQEEQDVFWQHFKNPPLPEAAQEPSAQ